MSFSNETGREFASAEDALAYMRECGETMLDPRVSQVKSMVATTELLYTFKALDHYLINGGTLPSSWREAVPPFGHSR